MKDSTKIEVTNDQITFVTDKVTKSIMHVAEKSLMKKFAEIGTQNGGDILEIGLGMRLSADFIQSNPNIKSHTIIEIHPEIYAKGLEWAKDKKNVKIILGDWVDVIPTLETKFDGILHDTFDEKNWDVLLDTIAPICKNNTVVVLFVYPIFDTRINGVRCPLDKDDFDNLPYNNHYTYKGNQFELKYTKFNGKNFYNETTPIKLM